VERILKNQERSATWEPHFCKNEIDMMGETRFAFYFAFLNATIVSSG